MGLTQHGPLLLAACVPIAAVAALLSPQLGGYGFITWCLHPLLAVFGILILGPLGLHLGVESPDRKWHALLLGGAAACVLAAAATAWGIHEAAGHRHFPRWEKSFVYQVHVFGGYAVAAALLAQVAGGAAAFFGLRGQPLEWLRKQHKSFGLAAASVLVLLTGFCIPMLVKGGAPLVFVALAAAILWGTLRSWQQIPRARGGGGK